MDKHLHTFSFKLLLYSTTFISLLVAFTPFTQAQVLDITQQGLGGSAQNFLLNNFVQGSCVTISNVTYTGSAQSVGLFDYGSFDGIILSTGNVNNAEGNPGGFASTSMGTAGNAQLTSIAGFPTYDAAVLQFDFIPTSNTISFSYRFASEEYPEWVSSSFNDVFAFGISGPGIAGTQNIAVVPGTGLAVSIDNVNQNANNQYYNANLPGQIFDGMTDLFTASTTVTPCQTYHLTLAIADAGDGIYDSAVFLEAQSFNAGSGAVASVIGSTLAGSNTTYEDCTTGYFRFDREPGSDITQPVTITFTVGGTANPNTDYNGPIPTTITIPAGQQFVQIPIIAVADGLAEGTETISLQLPGNSCTCSGPPPPVVMNIIDNPPIHVTVNSQTICPGQSVSITASATGGIPFPSYNYVWNTGSVTQSISGSPAATTTYTVTVSDICGNSATASGTVTVQSSAPVPIITAPNYTCVTGGTVALSANVGGGTWSGPGVNPTTGVFNPATALAAGGSIVTITYTVSGACGTGSATTNITIINLSATINPTQPTCANNGNNGSLTVAPAGGANYTYQWSTGGTNATINNQPAGTYFVTVTSVGGCSTVVSATLTAPQPPSLGINIVQSPTCQGTGNNGQVSASAVGGTPAYSFTWSAGNVHTPAVSNVPPGTYTLTVTDANNCIATSSVTLLAAVPPTASIDAVNPPCSGANSGTLTAVPNGGIGPYSFHWSNSQNIQVLTNVGTGNYIVTITDANFCTATAAALLTASAAVTASATSVNPSCANGGASGTATVTGLGGTTPYSYLWSNSQTAQTATNLIAGSYSVTVTDVIGCTAIANVSLNAPPTVNASATSTNPACSVGSTGTASVTASGGTPAYTYLWSNSQTSANISNLAAGSYTVTVTDSQGCTRTANVTLTAPTPITASTTKINPLCNNAANGTATVTASGGTPAYTYLWSNNQTAATATGLVAGNYTVTVTDSQGCSTTTSVNLNNPPQITASATKVDPLCNSGANGTATVTASGGTPAYTYLWSNSQTAATATGLVAATYTVTVTDSHGCSTTTSVTLNNPAPISASTTKANPLCNNAANGTATVTASGGTPAYTYLWSNGQTAATATGLTAATYTVTVTDSQGCSTTTTATLTQPTPVAASATKVDPLCNNAANGTATVTASGGTPGYTYLWTNNQTTPTATGLIAGTYNVTVTDSQGCSTVTSVTLNNPTALAASATGVNPLCNGASNGTATVTASGGTPAYTYLWSNSQTTSTATGLSVGAYTVTVTDVNGCSRTTTVTLTQPTPLAASATSVNPLCNGGANGTASVTASGGTPSYTYLWSNNQATANATGLAVGTYTVTVTDSQGCSTTTTVTLTQPTPVSVSATGTNPLCNGDASGSAIATASGGTPNYTYLWNNGQSNAAANNLAVGTYAVTATDSQGCTATTTVALTQPPPVTASATSTNPLCNGAANGTATATGGGGTPPLTYLWSNGQNTAAATGLAAGTHTVTVTDAHGCANVAIVTLTQPTPFTASATNTAVSCNAGSNGTATVTASGGTPIYTYLWSNSQTTATATGLTAGTYSVTVTDTHSCSTVATTTINQPTPLTASAVGVNPLCNGGANGTATATASGGTPAYTYLWSNGQTSANATGLMAGSYSVTITDANTCSTIATVSLTQPAPITATTTSTPVQCNGDPSGTATVTANGGTPPYTYLWSNAQTTQTANNLVAANYSVTVTDAQTCSTVATVTVTQPPPVTASATSTNPLCNGAANGTATATGGGGVPPLAYLWSNGQNTAAATGLAAGTHTVTVTDALGCANVAIVTLTQPTPLTASATNTAVSCNAGTNGTATVTASGGTPAYTYLWSNSQTTPTVSGLTAGTYSVTVTDNQACSTIVTTTITEPTPLTASATGIDPLCNGGANGTATVVASGGTPAYTYLWSNGQTTAIATGLTAGNYSVTTTDANACSTITTVSLTQPAPITATTTSTPVQCSGDPSGTATVTANGGTTPYTYLWNNTQTTQTATDLVAANYSVTVTDAQTCSTVATVTVTQPPPVTASGTGTNPLCNGAADGTATVVGNGGVPPLTYSWLNGQTTATATGLTAGTYIATVTDALGCANVAFITLTQPTAVVASAAATPTNCNGSSNGTATATATGGTAGYTFLWSDGQTTANASNLAAATYTVTATDSQGCTATATATVIEPTAVAVSATGTDPLCNAADNGSATATASGGTPAYTYLWNNGLTNANATGLIANTYTVTTTDSQGCTATTNVVLSEPTALTATTAATNPLCNAATDGTASVTAAGGTPAYTYFWTNGQSSQTANGIGAGIVSVTVTDANGCTITANANLSEPAPLSAVVSATDPVCNAGTDGSATVTASGGTPAYNYTWNNAQTDATATNLTANTYTVTVSDNNGCTTVADGTLNEPIALTVTINGTLSFCAGFDTNLSASNGFVNYDWSNQDNGQTTTVNAGGTYTVTATNVNGCTATASATVVQNANPTPTISGDLDFCSGASTTLNAPAGFSSYLWSTQENTQSVSTAAAGNYTVTVTDGNGCVGTTSVTVVVYANPMPNISGDLDFCDGAASTLDAGAGYANYTWLPAGNTQTIAVTALDTYSVTVTDNNGCTGTTFVNVTVYPLPIPAIVGDIDFCNGQNTTLDVGVGYQQYAWSSGDMGPTTAAFNGGTYTVTVTDSQGCTASTSIAVTEYPNPTPTIAGDLDFCNGASTTLNAPAGFAAYSWTPSGNTQNISVNNAGVYTVIVTDQNGCTGSASTTVIVYNNPTPTIAGDLDFCSGGNTTLTAPAGFSSYAWTPANNTSTITASAAGNYIVTVTDTNGCTGSTFAIVTVLPNPTPTVTGDNTICAGETTTFDAGSGYTNYAWTPAANSQSITASAAGTYTVTVTDNNGCVGSGNIVLNVTPLPIPGTFSATPANCGLFDGSLSYTNPSGASVSYSLGQSYNTAVGQNQAAPASPINNLTNDFYTFRFTAAGCFVDVTTEVPSVTAVPVPTVSPNAAICFTGSASNNAAFTANGGTQYQWYGPNDPNIVIAGATNATYTPTVTAAGAYIYYVSNSVGTCESAKVSTTLTINALPTPNLTGNTNFCDGATGSLDAGSGYNAYAWSVAGTNQSINITQAGSYSVTVTDQNGCTGFDNIAVVVNANPTPNITGPLTFCTGFNTTLNAGGGFANYAWNPAGNAQTLLVNAPGIYIVTVTDGNGCVGTDAVTVNENTSLSPNIDGNLSFCVNNNTVLDAGTGYNTYTWSPAGNTQTINVNTAGTYTVTVSDINGCTGTDAVTVNTNALPVPTVSGSNFCAGTSTLLIAQAGFTSYAWQNNETTQTTTVTAGGTYTLTVTDFNGCIGTNTVTVNEIALPTPNITGTMAFCIGASTTIDAGAGYSNYAWAPSGGTQVVTVNAVGTYTVTVTDANGCTGTDEATVANNPNPTPTISGALSFCEGFSSTLTANAGFTNYVWSTSTQAPSITVTDGGNYAVTVTDANGCQGSTNVVVVENTNLQPEILGNLIVCQGTNPILDAGSGYATYNWSTSDQTQTITVAASGTYTVTVSDASGCSGSDAVNVTVNPTPTPTITGTLSFCEGSTNQLNAGAGYTAYQWSTGGTSQNITVSTSDVYTVTVTDTNGCTATDDATVQVNANPIPNITGALSFCEGFNTTLDAGAGFANYNWSSSAQTQTITVVDGGTYTVTVTNASGCTATDVVVVTENTNLTPQINGTLILCNGNTTLLDAGTGYATYNWSSSDQTQTITVGTAATYSVTVSDASGCTGTDAVVLTVNANPTPDINGNLVFCAGNNSVLDAGAGFATYVWSPTGATQTISVTQSGDYAVTVTNANGCTGIDAVTVQVNVLPTPDITGALSFCEGFSTTLDAGAGFTAYAWQPTNETTQVITVVDGATYTVTVTNSGGCTATDQVTTTENTNLQPQITGNLAFCEGGSTLLDAGSGYNTYTWQPDSQSTQTISVSQTGTYTVTVTDVSGCSGSDEVTVTVNANPIPNISGTLTFCEGASSDLSVEAGFATYAWSPNAETVSNITITNSGDYTVTVTDANACLGTDMVTAVANPNPTPDITGQLSICTGFSTTLDAGLGYANYTWDAANQTTQTIVANTGGSYAVTVTDANGCVGTDVVTVIESNILSPQITGILAFCAGANTTLDAGSGFDTYTWTPTGNTQTINVTTAGTYTVTVTSGAGCSGTDEVTVAVNANPTPNIGADQTLCVGDIATLDAGNGYTVYTWTPAGNTQTITTTTAGTYTVTVTDANGCVGTDAAAIAYNAPPPPTVVSCASVTTNSVTFTWTAVAGVTNYLVSVDGATPQTIAATTFTVTPLAEGQTVELSVIAIGTNGCGNSTSATATCTTDVTPPCPPLSFNVAGINNGYCIDFGNDSFTITPAGGTLTIDGQASTGSFNTQTLGAGTHTVAYMLEQTNNGVLCQYDTTFTFIINPLPIPNFTLPTSACVGEEVLVTYTGTGNIVSYAWSFGLAGTRTGEGPHTVSWNTAGIHTITLTVTDNTGCVTTVAKTIAISSATVSLQASSSNLLFGTSADINAIAQSGLNGTLTYQWNPEDSECSNAPCSTITVTPNVLTTYTVTVTDSYGCQATAEQPISIYYQNAIIIPNALSPNGDNVNDIFRVRGTNIVEVQMQVFDRWGQLMYDSNGDINIGWNGAYKGKVMEVGVYVYQINVTYLDGTKEYYKGNLTLIL